MACARPELHMDVHVHDTKRTTSEHAAVRAAELLETTVEDNGHASFVAATGASQFDFLDVLTDAPDIDWDRTTMFHLDEYIGISETHPASFRKYMRERLISEVHPGTVYLVDGDAPDPQAECDRLNTAIEDAGLDVAFIGIGENGHLAFNDPPADFETTDPFIVVELDEACRRQQLGEGWFDTIDDVPERAISMSINQIMAADAIVCTVPGERKAQAVRDALEGPVTPECPASILQEHPQTDLYLDTGSASLLE